MLGKGYQKTCQLKDLIIHYCHVVDLEEVHLMVPIKHIITEVIFIPKKWFGKFLLTD